MLLGNKILDPCLSLMLTMKKSYPGHAHVDSTGFLDLGELTMLGDDCEGSFWPIRRFHIRSTSDVDSYT